MFESKGLSDDISCQRALLGAITKRPEKTPPLFGSHLRNTDLGVLPEITNGTKDRRKALYFHNAPCLNHQQSNRMPKKGRQKSLGFKDSVLYTGERGPVPGRWVILPNTGTRRVKHFAAQGQEKGLGKCDSDGGSTCL